MWVVVGLYAWRYKDHQENNKRFFSFYFLTYFMIIGLSLSANYITMYLFFEMMTLFSVPLVLHSGTREAVSAAKKYLFYSIFGATLGLLGMFFINIYGTTLDFVPGGVLDPVKVAGNENVLLIVAFLSVMGFGAKAGLFPLHSWLPAAHPVAPAPASALLSGIITKAGVLFIFRIIYYIFGIEFLKGTWVQQAWITLALVTVFLGSMMAYNETKIKTRLAYSTVSQVSYILTGLFFMNQIALTGALLHTVYHSIIKDALFLSAGNVIYSTHKENIDQLRGIGRKMPVTMSCFALLSFGLIGIPPFSGFLSKWNLAQGALVSGLPFYYWVGPVILLISALLTAGYLLPIVIMGFFPGKDFQFSKEDRKEAPLMMDAALVLLTAMALLLGMFAQPLLKHVNDIVYVLF
ncbi:MAG: proton-conducting membrane transporter [Clostridia bacterium]|nr:proton-conducting membrane transporter [Clostridia bacterium]